MSVVETAELNKEKKKYLVSSGNIKNITLKMNIMNKYEYKKEKLRDGSKVMTSQII